MKKAELQWNETHHPDNPALDTKSLNVVKTLEYLVEVINDMQEELEKKLTYEAFMD